MSLPSKLKKRDFVLNGIIKTEHSEGFDELSYIDEGVKESIEAMLSAANERFEGLTTGKNDTFYGDQSFSAEQGDQIKEECEEKPDVEELAVRESVDLDDHHSFFGDRGDVIAKENDEKPSIEAPTAYLDGRPITRWLVPVIKRLEDDNDQPHSLKITAVSTLSDIAKPFYKRSSTQKIILYHLCSICGKGYKFQSSLDRHMQRHSNERNFPCEHCGNSYKTENSLKFHLQSMTKQYNCNFCGQGLSSKFAVAEHVKSFHSSKESHPCEDCGKELSSVKKLAAHKRGVHGSNKIETVCDVCNKTFSKRLNMQKHYNRFHKCRTFTCEDCKAVFKYKERLLTHVQTVHLPPTHKCSVCAEMLPSKQSLTKHLQLAHNVGHNKFLFQCRDCGKSYKRNRSLKIHKRSHSDERPFECKACGKCFKSDSNLYQHSLTHSDARRFICGDCDKAFRIKHHLIQHMSTHLGGEKWQTRKV